MHKDPGPAHPLRHRRRDVLVLGRDDPWAGLEEPHLGPEGVEHRGDLQPGGAGADDQHRSRNLGQGPGVAMGGDQLGPRDGQPAADSARTEDDPVGPEPLASP